jgi:hypothetical protein
MGGFVEFKVLSHTLLVDTEDYEFVKTLGLSIVVRGHLRHVAINTQPYYKQYLHRILLGVTDTNIIVDHKNNNGLDNRRENLRLTNKVGNALNMRVNINKKSGLPKGVYKGKTSVEGKLRYRAIIQIDKVNWHLGTFDTIAEADAAYKKESNKYWSEL